MPKSTVTDAQHVVYTDHSIPRRPRRPVAPNRNADLVPFGGGRATDRDLGLAYAIAGQPERALKLLEAAERSAPDDVEVLVYLAEIYRNRNLEARAAPLYERALRLDGTQLGALVGLGGVRLQQGRAAEAIALWRDALTRNPGLDLTRTNLAMAEWQTGDREAAMVTLEKGLELSPGFRAAADLLKRLRAVR
jgi:tetratricopeptide (TPR) repeat protein